MNRCAGFLMPGAVDARVAKRFCCHSAGHFSERSARHLLVAMLLLLLLKSKNVMHPLNGDGVANEGLLTP